jgi:hypothetical protein
MIRSIGLDLGQAQDYTALAICEDDGEVWTITSLGRLPLGTPYPAVVERVVAFAASLPQRRLLRADQQPQPRGSRDQSKLQLKASVPFFASLFTEREDRCRFFLMRER